MLGHWLEFSARTDDIVESLGFYKALGFVELETNDTWTSGYAVVTDGDLSIGLHQRSFEAPAVTFVHQDVASYARSLTDTGMTFDVMHLDEDMFNEIGFADPSGNRVALVEARTFSRAPEAPDDSRCGSFFELTLPTRSVLDNARFWAPLAPAVEKLREEPTPHLRFDAGGLPLALSESIALDRPALCFKCPDRDALEQFVAARGLRHQAFPGFEGAFSVLQAPEGTRLYLFEEDFLGESIEVVEDS